MSVGLALLVVTTFSSIERTYIQRPEETPVLVIIKVLPSQPAQKPLQPSPWAFFVRPR